MNYKCNCASMWAIILSVANFAVVVCLVSNVDWIPIRSDYQTFIISVLTILVTVLVGFQIVNLVSVNNRIKDFEVKINVLEEKPVLVANDAAGELFARLWIDKIDDEGKAFFYMCLALMFLNSGTRNNEFRIREIEDAIISRVNKHSIGNKRIVLDEDKINQCCEIIIDCFENKRVAVELKNALLRGASLGDDRKPIKRF